MIDPLYSVAGFGVGLLVGMTGIGGGSLMTPILMLLFGIHPAAAVGSDLLHAAATKSAGSLVHGFARSIDWRVVLRLATGSVPAAMLTLAALSVLEIDGAAARALITLVLSGALFVSALILVFRAPIVRFCRSRFPVAAPQHISSWTVLVGAVLGTLVTVSSVGAGAAGVVVLLILYPNLPMARIVGTDIAHAVPLTLIGGAGYWMLGAVNPYVVASLLMGSVPGIVLGSYLAVRIPEAVLRLVLAGTLFVVASKLAFDHVSVSSSLLTALTRHAH
jgi:uncharacterized membrane protein YfcA